MTVTEKKVRSRFACDHFQEGPTDPIRAEVLPSLTLAVSFKVIMAGCCMFFPLADLVACIRSPSAEVTSFTALISIT